MDINSDQVSLLPTLLCTMISNSSHHGHQHQKDYKGISDSSFRSINESDNEESPSTSMLQEFSMDNRVTSRKFGGYRPHYDTISEPTNLDNNLCVLPLDCESYELVSQSSLQISDRSDNIHFSETQTKMIDSDKNLNDDNLVKVLSNMNLKRKSESNEEENQMDNEIECETSLRKIKNQSSHIMHEFSKTCFRSSLSSLKSKSPGTLSSTSSGGSFSKVDLDTNRYKPYDKKHRFHTETHESGQELDNTSEKVKTLIKTVIQVESKPLINETARLKRRISQNRFPFTISDHHPKSSEFEHRLNSHPSLTRLAEQDFEESTMQILHSIDYEKTEDKTKDCLSTIRTLPKKWKSSKWRCDQSDITHNSEIPVWGKDSESGNSSMEDTIKKNHCLGDNNFPFEIIFTGSDDGSDTDILLNVEIAGDYERWIYNDFETTIKNQTTPPSTKNNDRCSVFSINEPLNDNETLKVNRSQTRRVLKTKQIDKQVDCLCGGIYSTLVRIFTRQKR